MVELAEPLELAAAPPEVKVIPEEYTRLLGFPRGWVLEGRTLDLATWAREWYAANGKPWFYARQAGSFEIAGDSISIDRASFTSKRLAQTLEKAEAHSVVLAAVGAGKELEEETRRRWQDEKPDEYFFLEIFGSAVVEHLTALAGARLCDWAEQRGMAVLPHYSPGYSEWDVAEQPRLLELIKRAGKKSFQFQLEALDSGMLRPRKALLAVFGLTRRTDQLLRLPELNPCESCSFGPCQYRRAPYRRNPQAFDEQFPLSTAAPDECAGYSVNRKALERWAKERLTVSKAPDGLLHAVFRYDGTTCTNMGRPLAFLYNVKLGPRAQGYPIREQRCVPAPGDTGHKYMCQYLENPSQLMTAIEQEKPLNGERLSAVLNWRREFAGEGCFCTRASRDHKWGLALETIHYALANKTTDTEQ
ncbi:MAG: hypothetical protein ACM3NO_02935 [Deltaproteobacteria bacterium]